MCLESWINTKATNKNRGMVMSVYMVTSYLGAALGQLFLNIPDPSGLLLYIIISILFSLAMMPVSLTKLSAPVIETTSPWTSARLMPFRRSALSAVLPAAFWSEHFICWEPFMPPR